MLDSQTTTHCVVLCNPISMNEQLTYNYLDDYLNEVRSRGRHTFTLQEAKKHFSVSEKTLTQSIFRLKPKGKNAQVEQNLVLEHALIELFSDDFLRENLAFREGTALHNFFLKPQARYSEDNDFISSQYPF